MTIYTIDAVRSAYIRCLGQHEDHEAALQATAQSLCIPVEQVKEALREEVSQEC